jgi:hypothetical protein
VNTPSQEDLLGYVLGALDAQEQRDLEQLIDQNPEIEEQLLQIRTSMLPLDHLETAGPRTGLARRTCESVAGRQQGLNDACYPGISGTLEACLQAASADATLDEEPASDFRPSVSDRILHPSTWSVPDVLVGMALIAILAGILFPTISYTRYNSRLMACQHNLSEVGVALMNYSSANEGRFVVIPREGNLAVSGCFGPILKDAGFLEDDTLLSCAGVAANLPPVHIPSCEQVESAVCEREVDHLRRTMAGHFGYTMGYCENDQYVSPRFMGRTNVVLLADQPSLDLPGRRSANHSGRGQNCLFEDGRVEFVVGHMYGCDALFENDYGVVGPGSSAGDNVIAPSHLSPLQAELMVLHPDAR